jgi:hypothetical protein
VSVPWHCNRDSHLLANPSDTQGLRMSQRSYINATCKARTCIGLPSGKNNNHSSTLTIDTTKQETGEPADRHVELLDHSTLKGMRVMVNSSGTVYMAIWATISAAARVEPGFGPLEPGYEPIDSNKGGVGGGHGGYGANCDTSGGQQGTQQGLRPYGSVFGGWDACLDGTPGTKYSLEDEDGGKAGGQVIIHASTLSLDGQIDASGGVGHTTTYTKGSGGGSGGCVHLNLTAPGPDITAALTSSSVCTGDTTQCWSGDPNIGGIVKVNGGDGWSGGGAGRILVHLPNIQTTDSSPEHTPPGPATAIVGAMLNALQAQGGANLCEDTTGAAVPLGGAGTKFMMGKGGVGVLAIDGVDSSLNAVTPLSQKDHWITPTATTPAPSSSGTGQSPSGYMVPPFADALSAFYIRAAANVNADGMIVSSQSSGTVQVPLSDHLNMSVLLIGAGAKLVTAGSLGSPENKIRANTTSVQERGIISAQTLYLECMTLDTEEDSAIGGDSVYQNVRAVHINATKSMTIAGKIATNQAGRLRLECKQCDVTVDSGQLSAGRVSVLAKTLLVEGTISAAAVTCNNQQKPPDYPVRCPPHNKSSAAVQLMADNVTISASAADSSSTTKVTGESVLICPQTAHLQVEGAGDFQNSVRVDVGATISTRAMGCSEGAGPRKDSHSTGQAQYAGVGFSPATARCQFNQFCVGASGGGHGGRGGHGGVKCEETCMFNESVGGETYDLPNVTSTGEEFALPDRVGSGGGSTNPSDTYPGGGIIVIYAKNVTLNGTWENDQSPMRTLDARGADVGPSHTAQPVSAGGGGSGGTIIISTRMLLGNGVIDVSGGTGGILTDTEGEVHSTGGGGGGGIISLDWQGESADIAAADFARDRPDSPAGCVVLSGGCGSHAQWEGSPCRHKLYGQSPSPPAHCPKPAQRNYAGHGLSGQMRSPSCPAGFDGCICTRCAIGHYRTNSTKLGHAELCTDASERCIPCTNKPHDHVHNIVLSNYTRTGETSSKCHFECRPGLIKPDCLDPLRWLLDLFQSNTDGGLVFTVIVLAPFLLLVLLRLLFSCLLQDNAGTCNCGKAKDGDLSSAVNHTDSVASSALDYSTFGRHLDDDEEQTRSRRYAQRLRNILGWNDDDQEEWLLSKARGSFPEWATGSESQISGVGDHALQRPDLPYLQSRVYLAGENSPWRPWRLAPDPPATLTATNGNAEDALIHIDNYAAQAAAVTHEVRWTRTETAVYCLLALVCYPMALLWHERTRRKHYWQLATYVVTKFRHQDIFLDHRQNRTTQVKLGSSDDASLAFVDILVFARQITSEEERLRPRLPQMFYFSGDGSYTSPFSIDTSDVLAHELCKLAYPTFAADMNRLICTLGRDVQSTLDTSLSNVLDYIAVVNARRDSTLQFELRVVTEYGDRRLGLLARMRTWASSSSDNLTVDLSQELRLQQHKGQAITEDDLRDATLSGLLYKLLIWCFGLRNVNAPAAFVNLCRAAVVLLVFAEHILTLVALVAMAMHPWQWGGTLLLLCPPSAVLSVVLAPLLACCDLVFPEMCLTRRVVLFNLGSIVGVALFTGYVILNSQGDGSNDGSGESASSHRWFGTPKFVDVTQPGEFTPTTKSGTCVVVRRRAVLIAIACCLNTSSAGAHNVTLYACTALLVVKLARSVVSNFLSAALRGDQSSLGTSVRKSRRSSAGPPVLAGERRLRAESASRNRAQRAMASPRASKAVSRVSDPSSISPRGPRVPPPQSPPVQVNTMASPPTRHLASLRHGLSQPRQESGSGLSSFAPLPTISGDPSTFN